MQLDGRADGQDEQGGASTPASRSRLGRRLADARPGERERIVLGLVYARSAVVLGHESPGAMETGRAFKELGFDSRAALELRDRLRAHSGLRLPASLLDHPTPKDLATYLLEALSHEQTQTRAEMQLRRSEEPIAIVGMGCRLPGRGALTRELWDLVLRVRNVTGFARSRSMDGTSRRSTITFPPRRHDELYAGAASSTVPRSSTPRSSGSRRARPGRWIRSSDCFSSSLGGARAGGHRSTLAEGNSDGGFRGGRRLRLWLSLGASIRLIRRARRATG